MIPKTRSVSQVRFVFICFLGAVLGGCVLSNTRQMLAESDYVLPQCEKACNALEYAFNQNTAMTTSRGDWEVCSIEDKYNDEPVKFLGILSVWKLIPTILCEWV